MRFHPASVDVPAGDRLVIELTNTDDEDVHDLVLDDGSDTGRLSPGESARIDVGVVGRDVAGWCSVVGHHQMGMAFAVRVVGAASDDGPHGDRGVRSRAAPPHERGRVDLGARPRARRSGPAGRDAPAPPSAGRARAPAHAARARRRARGGARDDPDAVDLRRRRRRARPCTGGSATGS